MQMGQRKKVIHECAHSTHTIEIITIDFWTRYKFDKSVESWKTMHSVVNVENSMRNVKNWNMESRRASENIDSMENNQNIEKY